jgi:hypothetical protein
MVSNPVSLSIAGLHNKYPGRFRQLLLAAFNFRALAFFAEEILWHFCSDVLGCPVHLLGVSELLTLA